MAQGKKHIPNDDTRRAVREASGLGLPHKMICTLIGINCVDLLGRNYRQELDEGMAQAALRVTKILMRKIDEGDTPSIIFYLKTQLGWREKQEDVNTDLVTVLTQLIQRLPG